MKTNQTPDDTIKKLSEYQHARLRTEMYLGSRSPHTQQVIVYDESMHPISKEITWVPALYTAFREILDNSLDETVGHGFGDRVDIDFNERDLIFTIVDNGRGIPFDILPEYNISQATLAMSHARAGRNFDERGTVAGANGIGGATVNFCSEYMKLEIFRNGKHFVQEFKEGNAAILDELLIGTPKVTTMSGTRTGTSITFKLSRFVFEDSTGLKNNMILPLEFVRSRVIDVAICNPSLKVFFNGERIKVKPKPEQTLFNQEHIQLNVEDKKFSSKFFLLPNWNTEGEFIHTVVNNIPAFNGGSHIDAFRRTFYRLLLAALEKESKRRKLYPNNADVQAGLLIFNITKMAAPNFDSQSKTRLINEDAGTIIRKQLENEDIYKEIIKKNKWWIEQIYQRCSDRTQKRDASDLEKMSKRVIKNKIPKLMDANGKDRSKCILYMTEGDSALAGLCNVRNPEIHGGMPLRGKLLNAFEETPKRILENKELVDIMNAVGLVMGQKVDRSSLRYGKLYIATDMDHDGSNILALLISFLFRFWPALFDKDQEPFVYAFQTPYVIAEKGQERKYWYAHDYENFNPDDYKGWTITRAKGLGTLTKEDWKYSLLSPVAIPILDDGTLGDLMTTLFDPTKADLRKTWMGI